MEYNAVDESSQTEELGEEEIGDEFKASIIRDDVHVFCLSAGLIFIIQDDDPTELRENFFQSMLDVFCLHIGHGHHNLLDILKPTHQLQFSMLPGCISNTNGNVKQNV